MIRIAGGVILLALVGGGAGLLFARETARAWDNLKPGTRPTPRQAWDWSAARTRSATSAARARAARARQSGFRGMKVRGVTPAAPAPPPSGPAAPAPPAPAPQAPAPAAQEPGPILTGTVVTAPPKPAPPQAPAPPTGRTSPVTTQAVASAPLAEDITTAYANLGATVASGNINVKTAAYAAMAESFDAAARVLRSIGRSMEEESLYGPEITEPAQALAAWMEACARSAADVEEQLRSLAATPVGEMPASRHQAPDRRELAESGGR